MTVRTSPRNWLSALARGSLPARRGNARRAAGPCLAALAFCTILAACSEGQSASEETQAASLEEFFEKNMVRTADCNGTGTVANSDSKYDFITVFSGPSISSPPQIRLKIGVLMHLCTRAENGRYVGIIYQSDGELAELSECEISTDGLPRYERPCISGWVKTRDIEDGRIAARYSERKETKAADEEAAFAPGDDMAAIDRLNDQLNSRFPVSKYMGFMINYRSLGTGCQGFIRNEIYQQGDKLDHSARFDYSEIASVGEVYHNTSAEPEIFHFSLQLAPDETGVPRVKISASRDGYDTTPQDNIELGLLQRETAEEVRETLLQLRSLCRARKRREQANAADARYRASRDPDLHVAADRHHLAQGGAHARDLG
jgi:hypothetical protein